jgi:hypothetical protein
MTPGSARPGFTGSKGQGLVEFALVVPLFLLLVIAIFELGRAVYYVQMLDSAAREGMRYAIVHGSRAWCPSGPMPAGEANPCDAAGTRVVARVKGFAIAVIDSPEAAFVVTPRWCQSDACPGILGDGDNQRGMEARIELTYTYRTFVGAFLPLGDLRLTGESRGVVNH